MKEMFGPVEQDLGADVGDLDGLAGEGHVDHAEGGDGPGVGQHHVLGAGHAVGGARTPGGHVDLVAHRAALADELPLGQRLGGCGTGRCPAVNV